MALVKRWAFLPLLAIVLAAIGGGVAAKQGHSLLIGNVIGLVVAVPIGFVIARRRRLHGW